MYPSVISSDSEALIKWQCLEIVMVEILVASYLLQCLILGVRLDGPRRQHDCWPLRQIASLTIHDISEPKDLVDNAKRWTWQHGSKISYKDYQITSRLFWFRAFRGFLCGCLSCLSLVCLSMPLLPWSFLGWCLDDFGGWCFGSGTTQWHSERHLRPTRGLWWAVFRLWHLWHRWCPWYLLKGSMAK